MNISEQVKPLMSTYNELPDTWKHKIYTIESDLGFIKRDKQATWDSPTVESTSFSSVFADFTRSRNNNVSHS